MLATHLSDAESVVTWYLETAAHRLLTLDEELELGRRIQTGDQAAFQELVRHNLRLVVRVATPYRGRGLAMEDLIQEGNLGLMVAARKFDPSRGLKFSTMATSWIRQRIERSLFESGACAIRLPVHLVEWLRKLRQAEGRLALELGREPTDREIARALGVPVERLAGWRQAARQQQVASLNTPAGGHDEEDADQRGAFIPDESVDVLAEAESSERRAIIGEQLRRLSPRERYAVIRRYGLDGGEPAQLEVIGKSLGLTRERVRQIIDAALQRLADAPALKALRDAA
jgi:RNA polymerase primary sigma factor